MGAKNRLGLVLIALLLSVILNLAGSRATPTPVVRKDDSIYEGDAAIPTQAPAQWIHPGVFVNRQQLDHVSEKVAASAQPWSDAFRSTIEYNYTSPTRTAKPYATVECGPTSTPNIGCYQEREDSMAAYANALAWWITGESQFAEKSVHYMNSWSGTIKAHTNSNAPLQAAWAAANWVRAGEIMRYSYQEWSSEAIASFESMLRKAYLPLISDGDDRNNGNWELVMNEAAIGAAVFLEDASLYSKSMDLFAKRVPAYVYLTSDGEYPVPARGVPNTTEAIVAFWQNQATFPVSGITQETCRDFAHLSYGISSMAHIAETSRIQGQDLWKTDLGPRVQSALELHTPFITGEKQIPEWLCNGIIARSIDPMLEAPYNALSYRNGKEMPFTKNLLLEQRPAEIGEPNPLFIGFETVTNAENPF